jgi:outer membrane protein assembly factor BamB
VDVDCSSGEIILAFDSMPRRLTFAALSLAAAVSLSAQAPPADDWPQWRGPNRDGLSSETGLVQEWSSKGPPVVWTAPGIGAGYGTVAISGARVFVQGLRGRDTMVHALNRQDGTYAWSKSLGRGGDNDRGPGPRGTPTVDGDRLYILTESGDLWCLKQDGTEVWHRNVLREFSGSNIPWLISESPLVDGDRVVVTPGGVNASLVALDKMTGKTIWTSKELSDAAGYSSVVVVDVEGIRAYTTFTAAAAVGVRASDGKLMWRYPAPANRTANIATPVVQGNRVFYTSDYGTGAGLLTLRAQNGELVATPAYFTEDMQNHHGGVVLVDGTIYGFNNSILTAIDFATGKRLWRDRSVGKGSVTYADHRLYLLSEDNVVGLAEVSPQGYHEKGRFEIADTGLPSWAHPVVSGGRLYLRNQNSLSAYDIKAR